VATVAYSPFGHDSFPAPNTSGGRLLQQIAAAHDATPRQVALRFLVRLSSVFAIPKASTPEHAADNAGAGRLHLAPTEIAAIEQAFPLGRRPRSLPML
jgi:diketogulonate reductase-like aldo/keto reductase